MSFNQTSVEYLLRARYSGVMQSGIGAAFLSRAYGQMEGD